jgi:hypothetical protein
MASSSKSISKPVAFRVNVSGVLYFNSKDLQEFDAIFYHGCKTKPRNILVKKNIPSSEYMYANFNTRNGGSWITSTEECKKAQLLITKTWVEAHMRSMNEARRNEPDQSIQPIVPEKPCDISPPLVFIEESRKFRDDTENTVDIEVRGILADDSSQSSVFFRCSDVAFACDMFDLSKVITQSDKVYREKIDYVYFQTKGSTVDLYLTREGVVKVFDDTKDDTCRRFMQWVMDVSCLKKCVEKERKEESHPVAASIDGGGGGGGSEQPDVKEEYEAAPDPLYLEEHEKFRDADGNILEIETVCRDPKNRTEMNTFFRCSDVSEKLDLPSLNKNVTRLDQSGGYSENIDYRYFNPYCSPNRGAPPNKNANKYAIYLTFEGLLRVLFVSRNKNISSFRIWATTILFTHQLGTKEAKRNLAAKLAGIDLNTFNTVFDKHASKFPCIYLMHLGKVKDLRETFGIDPSVVDDLVVYKYGLTNNMERRFNEHIARYGENIKLNTFHVIDPQFLHEAEGEVRQMMKFNRFNLSVEGNNELVSLSKEGLEHVKIQYGHIGQRYAGASAESSQKIEELRTELKDARAKHEFELEKERYERRIVELKKQIVEMERDNYKRERDDYKRERDDYKVTIDRLNR